MAGQRPARAWWHASPWLRFLAFALVVALVAIEPAPLLPVAHAYAALCERYPPLALIANHVPPLPLALFLSLAGAALLAGIWTGVVGLLATMRFTGQLRQDSEPIPSRLASIAEDLGLLERVTYAPWPPPLACCYGFARPRIAVTAGLLERLEDEQLAAVLGHEREHVRRRDPLRYLALDVLTAASFMIPVAPAFSERWRTRAELTADRAALVVTSRGALAGALLALIHAAQTPAGIAGLTATEARIAQLGGEPVLPTVSARAVIASLALAAAVVLAMASLAASPDLVRMACPFCPWLP